MSTTFIDSAHLDAHVPATLLSAAGSANIAVLNADGTASVSRTFTITPQLSITSWSPETAVAGGPDLKLTVNGTGFIGAIPPLVIGCVVKWNGSSLQTQYMSGKLLWATVPAALISAPGTATITVRNAAGAESNAVTITITTAPASIASLTPASVSAGGPAFTLLVNGSGFFPGAAVHWSGLALTTTFVSATQLTASVPASLITAPGAVSVSVINPDGVASEPVTFSVDPANPTISVLSPASAEAGGPDFTVGVYGSGFLPGAAIWWNNLQLATTFIGPAQLTASVPAALIAAPGTAGVKVVNPGGAASSVVSFDIRAAAEPAIAALSPASAVAGGAGFTLSIQGSGFVSGAAAQWNGSPLPTTFIGAAELRASVPAAIIAAPGSASVTVLQPDGAVSNAKEFLILPASSDEVTIAEGGIVNAAGARPVVAPGSLISIYGTNLAKDTASATTTPLPRELNGSGVFINGNAVPLLFVSPTQINAQVPYETAAGMARVVVKANSQTSAEVFVEVRTAAPGTFTVPESNHALAQNAADWSLNSPQNPASPGDAVVVYLTGQGLVDNPVATGAAAPPAPLSYAIAPVRATIGGQPATVLFAGLTPGQVGLLQVNLIIPPVAAGEQPLELLVGDAAANTTMPSVREK